MRTPLTDEDLFAALDAEQYFESSKDAANSLGLKTHSYRWRLNAAKERVEGYEPSYGESVKGFSTPFLPTDKMPTDELIGAYDQPATTSGVMPKMLVRLSQFS